jgi:uncharacterized protein (DUF427 family)
MPKALWKGVVIAEADAEQIEKVEGNVYFPPESLNQAYVRPSETHTVCSWKGTASYYDVVVEGQVNKDAAWYYPQPKSAAQQIANHVAFWRGVTIED